MNAPFIINCLLVSSPNNGGITLISNHTATVLEQSDTTGIWLTDSTLYRNAILAAPGSKQMQLELVTGSEKIVIARDDEYDFHDVLLHGNELYLVSTGTNEIIVFNLEGSRTRTYPFPGRSDSWHINCLGIWNNRIVASAFGEFDTYRGYKNNTLGRGFVFDLESKQKIWEGLSQPHTPVQYRNKYYVCNSERMEVLVKNEDLTGAHCIQLDGYTRGIAFDGDYMYVGLSQSRNKPDTLSGKQSRIVAIDIRTHQVCGQHLVPFSEIYDIRILKNPAILPSLFKLSDISALQIQATEYAELQHKFSNMLSQFQRINNHMIMGRILRLMRWIKRDVSFGNPQL